ncbi:MAG: YkgJ family cysteine cluster protein [Desulfobulbaceae bacterium]|nr:YkgJ family cysteine cluster protein [Desulfobulbaceae bacterium]
MTGVISAFLFVRMTDTREQNIIPEGRTAVGKNSFQFRCHPGVSCYRNCCRQLDMYLYPYDVLRLKNCLKIHSAEFMRRHTRLAGGSHPFFPAVMLNMAPNRESTCPFLGDGGCEIYKARPSACRTYPLERAVEKTGPDNRLREHYFMTHHDYCRGHEEKHTYTIKQWERDQDLYEYNLMNDLWAVVDAFFATNPWQGEGKAGPMQQLAFMVCYNIDDFRIYCSQNNLLRMFRLDKERRRRIEGDDAELLRFGFDWLQFVLGGRRTLFLR